MVLFGVSGEFLMGVSLGFEWVSDDSVDEYFSYLSVDLLIYRLLFTFERV